MTELEITPEPVSPPTPTYVPPKPKSPLGPILIGFFSVIILSALLGFFYFKAKFQSDLNTTSASPTPIALASAEPSVEPSVVPAELEPEPSASAGKGGAKPTLKPVSAIPPVKSPSPTPTPIPQVSLDIRFGNPSVNIKQTIDEGGGDGRVINREYTSLQSGTFDEVSSTWSPRVTVCYHIVANENIAGKDLKFKLIVDDKSEVEDNMGQYDKLEAGRIYDWCHDTTTNIGKHTARMTINGDKTIKESNYNNNIARVDWENLPDKIAPNYTITGPTQDGTKTCLAIAYLSDNVTKTSDLKIEEKYNAGSWATTTSTTYCATGTSVSEHTYSVKVGDARGNVNEQTKSFVLY